MNIDKLEENSVWKIILALALPTMIGQLGTILYNMADTYFIGQVNDVNQVAAIAVTMPVFLVSRCFVWDRERFLYIQNDGK